MNIKKFKYTKLFNEYAKKINYHSDVSADSKLKRKTVLDMTERHILELMSGDELDNLYAKELKLEREYIWKLEKVELGSL
jgi:hypothetical protein